jgi:hypothetical protein
VVRVQAKYSFDQVIFRSYHYYHGKLHQNWLAADLNVAEINLNIILHRRHILWGNQPIPISAAIDLRVRGVKTKEWERSETEKNVGRRRMENDIMKDGGPKILNSNSAQHFRGEER